MVVLSSSSKVDIFEIVIVLVIIQGEKLIIEKERIVRSRGQAKGGGG